MLYARPRASRASPPRPASTGAPPRRSPYGASVPGQRREGRGAQQRRPAGPFDLAPEERRRVHQAERRMRQNPGLGRLELRPQAPQDTDPLLDVEALEAADLAARFLRQ